MELASRKHKNVESVKKSFHWLEENSLLTNVTYDVSENKTTLSMKRKREHEELQAISLDDDLMQQKIHQSFIDVKKIDIKHPTNKKAKIIEEIPVLPMFTNDDEQQHFTFIEFDKLPANNINMMNTLLNPSVVSSNNDHHNDTQNDISTL